MSNNILWNEVAAAQNQKEAVINQQASYIDAALTEQATLLGAGPFTLTDTELQRLVNIKVDAAATSVALTITGHKKLFIFDNKVGTTEATVTKGTTTIAVPAGVALPFYSGDGVDDLFKLTGFDTDPVSITVSAFKAQGPSAGETLLLWVFNRDVTFPVGLTDSQAYAGLTPTTPVSVDIQKNGGSIGSADWAASANVGTFTFTTETSFTSGDVLALIAPNPADATFGDISISLVGTTS